MSLCSIRVILRLASSKVTRGEVLLEKIGPAVGLTPCGKDWLTLALDPFHDNQLTSLSGWPDVVTNPSIVHTVKETFIITAPSDVGGETYNAHLHVFPWLANQNLCPTTTAGGNRVTVIGVTESHTYHNVSVITAKSSSPFPTFGDVDEAFEAHIPTTLTTGRGRLIGMGIEAVDVSAELYKQGTVLGYRSIGTDRDDPETWYINYAAPQYCSMFNMAPAPETTESAMLMPGTRQWGSPDGAYLVIPIGEDNSPELAKPIGCYVYPSDEEIVSGSVNNGKDILTPFTAAAGVNTLPFNHMVPIPSTGLMWSGLNAQSVIQVKVIWYYESFPAPRSPYITLAKPSCEYDPVALKLYTEVFNSLPIVVPSDWNAAGDWWWDVVSAIRENAEAVGSIFGGPGKMVGAAVSKLAGWGQDNYMTAPGQSGKPKQKQGNQNRGGGGGGKAQQTVTKTVVQQNVPKRQNNAPNRRQQQAKKVTTTVVTNNPNRK